MGYVTPLNISESEYIAQFMGAIAGAKRGGMSKLLRALLLKMTPYDEEDAIANSFSIEEHRAGTVEYVARYIAGLIPDFFVLNGTSLHIFEVDGHHSTPIYKYIAYGNFADAHFGDLDVTLTVYDVRSDTTYFLDKQDLAAASVWAIEVCDDDLGKAPTGSFLSDRSTRRHGFHHELLCAPTLDTKQPVS